jgi:hypothetical protein
MCPISDKISDKISKIPEKEFCTISTNVSNFRYNFKNTGKGILPNFNKCLISDTI